MTNQLPPDVVIPRALGTIEAVWAETLDPPRAPAGNSGGGGGKPASRAPMPDAAFDARRAAAEILSAWCVLVGDERGVCPVRLGSEAVLGMTAWLTSHVDWLAGHELGDQAAQELNDLAVDLDRLVHPDRRDDLFIGRCPVECIPGAPPCNRRLYWPKGAHSLTCPGCGVEDDVEGWVTRMGAEDSAEVAPATTVITYIASEFGRVITQEQLWQWATRADGGPGRRPTGVHRHGRNDRGQTLYALTEVAAWCRKLWKLTAA